MAGSIRTLPAVVPIVSAALPVMLGVPVNTIPGKVVKPEAGLMVIPPEDV